MNEDEKLSEIADQLKRLRPAQAAMDANVLFYQAGFNACKSQMGSRDRVRIVPLIAAGLLAAIMTAPAGYRVGRSAALRAEPEAERVVAVIDTTETELPPEQQQPDQQPVVDSSPESDQAIGAPRSELFARWIDPYGAIAESARLDKKLETTLAVYHSSLVSRQDASQNWIDFPFSTTLLRQRDWGSVDSALPSGSTSPLAVNDLSQLAQSLEIAR